MRYTWVKTEFSNKQAYVQFCEIIRPEIILFMASRLFVCTVKTICLRAIDEIRPFRLPINQPTVCKHFITPSRVSATTKWSFQGRRITPRTSKSLSMAISESQKPFMLKRMTRFW